jgi:hypothetical protein
MYTFMMLLSDGEFNGLMLMLNVGTVLYIMASVFYKTSTPRLRISFFLKKYWAGEMWK